MQISELLSIFIPTYNRHEYLKECLDSIIPQLKNRDEGINIYISNNYLNDSELYEIIEKYKKFIAT